LFAEKSTRYQEYLRLHKINLKNRSQLVQLFGAMNADEKKSF
jgi:hypothetical protein